MFERVSDTANVAVRELSWVLPRTAVRRSWDGTELVQLFPRGRAHSIGVVLDPTRDHILDIWVPAESGEPEWKDEHELDHG